MSSTGNRRMVRVLIAVLIALSGLVSASSRVRADDEATKIYQLARSLHYEDKHVGGFTVWVNGDIGEDSTARRTGVSGGEALPTFNFKIFDGNGTLQPKDMTGPYILNFWASWCSPCREEFPLFIKGMEDKSLTIPVVFVNVMDFKAYAETFLQNLDSKTTLAVVVDPGGALYIKMGFSVLPYTILVDADGKVQAIQVGEMSELALEFFTEIAAHPGIGRFDRLHPDVQPVESTATPAAESTPAVTSEA